MNLVVTDTKRELSFNEITMSISEFAFIGNHPYIATAGFDTIIVDLDKRIPPGYLKTVIGKMKVVPRIVGELDTDVIRLLGEIYRDKEMSLKMSWFKGKDEVQKIINNIKEEYNWESYYN